MKNGSKTKTYSVIAALLLLASCNEKVNPSLQESNTTITPPPTVTVDKYFRLVNTSDTVLGYHLHKTGSGNFNTKCEVNAPSFSTALYAGVPSTYDVTCFLEAEELALIFNGVKWNIEAAPNTCEYVGYTPFTFYQYQPGSSTRTVSNVKCASGITNAGGNRPACNGYYQDDPDFQAGSPYLQIPSSSVTKDEDLCRFDYSASGGPNCDEGIITIIERPFDYATPGDNSTPITAYPTTTRRITCGGSRANCVNGPIKDVASLATAGSPIATEIIKAELDKSYSQEYTIKGPREKGYNTNLYAANYMRQCSGVNYNNDTYDYAGLPIIGFNPTQTTFNPTVMDLLSKNWRRDYNHTNLGTRLFNYSNTTTVNPGRFLASNEKVQALANSPFSGSSAINPYYSFYCLNKAQDVKARIRVVIRDWDRAFDIDPIMEVMSDVYNGLDSLMDNNYDELGNLDIYDSFNDKADWDDFLLFQTPIDNVVPSTDIPACQVPYPHTLEPFSHDSFPQGAL